MRRVCLKLQITFPSTVEKVLEKVLVHATEPPPIMPRRSLLTTDHSIDQRYKAEDAIHSFTASDQ